VKFVRYQYNILILMCSFYGLCHKIFNQLWFAQMCFTIAMRSALQCLSRQEIEQLRVTQLFSHARFILLLLQGLTTKAFDEI